MLTESQLLAIIHAHRRDALGEEDGDLSNERAEALDHYQGSPYGDEQEGRSQVVSRDLSETVDWVLPSLLKIFTQSGNIAEFIPVGPEDEEGAQQESDYTNHVLMQDNNGFLLLHDVFKDALILKNSYAKHWYEETEKVREVEYSGLTIEELAKLMSDLEAEADEIEVLEQEETIEIINGQAIPLYEVKLSLLNKIKKFRVEPVPVEEVRVSKRCRGSLQDSPYVEHVTRRTRTELIEMGMDDDFVYSLAALDEEDNDQLRHKRDTTTDETDDESGATFDRSMDEIEYAEAYLRVDWDDDGRAELRKIVTAGGKIPPGDEWNEQIDSVPLTGFVTKRMPHRHIGESLDDELKDLQRIKTVLMRQLLDNAYLTNNPMWNVNERVNLNDMLQAYPGAIRRIAGDQPVSGSVEAQQVPQILGQILPVIDYVDNVKENRTGITKASVGMDPDTLREATKGAFMENLNRASQKVEMIARLLAEAGGVKELVLRVHELILKHQDKPRIVKLRGKYVPVDPRNWRERTDLRIKVGLGTGNEAEKREKLQFLVMAQEKAGTAFGLVGPMQAYNMFRDLAETLGERNPEKYVLNPQSPEYQQMMQAKQEPPPNPLAEVEQVKGQFAMQRDQMKYQMESQMEMAKMQSEQQFKMLELRMDAMQKAQERQSREAIEIMRGEIKAIIEGIKLDIGQRGIGAEVSQ